MLEDPIIPCKSEVFEKIQEGYKRKAVVLFSTGEVQNGVGTRVVRERPQPRLQAVFLERLDGQE